MASWWQNDAISPITPRSPPSSTDPDPARTCPQLLSLASLFLVLGFVSVGSLLNNLFIYYTDAPATDASPTAAAGAGASDGSTADELPGFFFSWVF